MIDEADEGSQDRLSRAEQRARTRAVIIEATVATLVDSGYTAFTTRRVAERAGVAQSTVMHHFDTREALLLEAVTRIAQRLADRALTRLDLSSLRAPEQRLAVLDEAWSEFTSPESLAAVHVWISVWNEPELAGVLRQVEERVSVVISTTVEALWPGLRSEPLVALIDTCVSVLRGLILVIPISGEAAVTARWEEIKPILLAAAERVIPYGGA